MITPALIKADVVDIRKPASATPPDMVTDANVLYWVFYPNGCGLSAAPIMRHLRRPNPAFDRELQR